MSNDILNEMALVGGAIPTTVPLSGSGQSFKIDYKGNDLTFADLFEEDENEDPKGKKQKKEKTSTSFSKSSSEDIPSYKDGPDVPKDGGSQSGGSKAPLSTLSGGKGTGSENIKMQDVGSEGLTDIKVVDVNASTKSTVSEMFDFENYRNAINESMTIDLDDEDDEEEELDESAASDFIGSFDELLNEVATRPDAFVGQLIKQMQDRNQGLAGEDRKQVFDNAVTVVKYTVMFLRNAFNNTNNDVSENYDEVGSMEMVEHQMNGSELAMTIDLAIAMFKSIRDQAPNDDKIGSIARGLAMCCDGEDKALDVSDKDKIDAAMADAYTSEHAGDDMGDVDDSMNDADIMTSDEPEDVDDDYVAPDGDGELTDIEGDDNRVNLMSDDGEDDDDLEEDWDIAMITSKAFH